MKQFKVLDIHDYMHLVCIRVIGEKDPNPYRLFMVYYSINKDGYTTKHKKLIAKYADIVSVLCMVKDMYINNVQHMTYTEAFTWCKTYYGK